MRAFPAFRGYPMEGTMLLKQCVLFKDLSHDEIQKLQSIARIQKFTKDSIIFNRGDLGRSLYLILQGSVRVSVILDDIGEEILAMLKDGSHFGEMALVDEGPRSATVIAQDDTILLRLDKDEFEKVMISDRDMELKILRNMVRAFSSRIRDTDQSLTFLRFTLRTE
jgi:CRP/FNR family transcriptional regulator, cyclic AMP receptor protein